ncbi:hypothetical protein BC834DRAFT_867837 [Gloeopeniophorella convolvens]|nr:hypothetical protein BC834DRAFT_867837 [Gloeopeniophorella convolvens]
MPLPLAEDTRQVKREPLKAISLNTSLPPVCPSDAAKPNHKVIKRPTMTQTANNEEGHDSAGSSYTTERAISWVMSKDSVAACFVRDVLSMPECEGKGLPYYLLGRVPCRSVLLVAIVVGAAKYESRIVYTLDDGSGTLECVFRTDQDMPTHRASGSHDISLLRPAQSSKPKPLNKDPDIVPFVPVGTVVRVTGKIRSKHSSRDIHGESIDRCKGPRDELDHWRRVSVLHKTYYYSSEPFVIPPLGSTDPITCDVPRTPCRPKTQDHLALPSSPLSVASASAVSSPTKSLKESLFPPQLRHPSRLRSRDLTANTFRIYVKHLMDNLCLITASPTSETGSDTESITETRGQTVKTPTKRSYPFDDSTPRPSRSANVLLTPRPRYQASAPLERSDCRAENTLFGCTLSYLRRVPELATLAHRVVEVEARRRKEEKRSQSENVSTNIAGKGRAPPSSAEGTAPKVKRLFTWAIRKLYRDGGIILWDGPVIKVIESHTTLDSSILYRSSGQDSFSSTSTSSRSPSRLVNFSDDDINDLSDPPSDEEAYAPLSTPYLATHVEHAIRSLSYSQKPQKRSENTHSRPAVHRKRHLPPPGPTKDAITDHIKRSDDRWKRLSPWSVQEALEWLRDEGRVWCVSEDDGGRWELCS